MLRSPNLAINHADFRQYQINTDPCSGSLTSSLTNGGTAGLFWGYTIVVIAFFLIYASLAEMAAM